MTAKNPRLAGRGARRNSASTRRQRPFRLLTFDEAKATAGSTIHLLLGNGFSIACDQVFAYQSLYEQACSRGLSTTVKGVFDYLGTNNFEGAMRLLEQCVWLGEHYNVPDAILRKQQQDLESIKTSLITTISDVHVERPNDVPEENRARCRAFLRPFTDIFSLNYDLLLYWVTMSEEVMERRDGFGTDPENPDAPYVVFLHPVGGGKAILFPHGALHLYSCDGQVRKHSWRRTDVRLIQHVREGINNQQYPLFVAEGAPEKKLLQIQANSYLAYCLGKLGRITSPLFIHGWSMEPTDQHIFDSLAAAGRLAKIYVSLYGSPRLARNLRIRERVAALQEKRAELLPHLPRGNLLEADFYSAESACAWDA